MLAAVVSYFRECERQNSEDQARECDFLLPRVHNPQSVQLQVVGVWRNEIQTLRHPVPGQAWADGAMCISGTSGGGSKLVEGCFEASHGSVT